MCGDGRKEAEDAEDAEGSEEDVVSSLRFLRIPRFHRILPSKTAKKSLARKKH
jgi:hypothetical protein